jgi:hypothetical protein
LRFHRRCTHVQSVRTAPSLELAAEACSRCWGANMAQCGFSRRPAAAVAVGAACWLRTCLRSVLRTPATTAACPRLVTMLRVRTPARCARAAVFDRTIVVSETNAKDVTVLSSLLAQGFYSHFTVTNITPTSLYTLLYVLRLNCRLSCVSGPFSPERGTHLKTELKNLNVDGAPITL